MQDRASFSTGELSPSIALIPGSTSSASSKSECQHRSTANHRWSRPIVFVLCTLSFAALIVCSELIVTNFRALAAEPTNGALQDNVLLDFTAKWCGPCQQMSPIVSRLERQNFPIRKVDIDAEPGLARQFGIDSIPCFVLVVNGKELNRITGATDERELRRLLAMLPKQNIDDAMIAGNSKSNRSNNLPGGSVVKTAVKTADDKKSFLRMPALFNRNQEKDLEQDVALTPTTPDTFRGQNPQQDASSDGYAKDPQLVSVRIRVKDGSRLHYGSGTIIESQAGRSVLLTCGHIFRDLGKDAVIEVDLFSGGNSKQQTLTGDVLRVDMKADLGLVSIPTRNPIPVIRLSTLQGLPNVKDRVLSYGCGGGERPTREDHQITAFNRYVGPDNIECDGVPQQGRSGGGLFVNANLIGVCIAADKQERRGIYTSMKPIAQLLEKAQLGHLVPTYLTSNDTSLADKGSQTQEATLGNPVDLDGEPKLRRTDDIAGILEEAARGSVDSSALSASVGDYVGAEIVCIVRPKTPGATTRVVIVNQASSRFVNDLLHEPNPAGRGDATASTNPSNARRAAEQRAKSIESLRRMAKQAPSFDDLDQADTDGPVETSFEPNRYRRK